MEIRKLKIAFWAVLILLTIGMLGSAVPAVLQLPYAVEHFVNVLHLPLYLLAFTGAIKLAGLVVLYLPGYYRLKEWVFAGFVFDLVGAWYCNFISRHSFAATWPVLLYLLVLLMLYGLYRKIEQSRLGVNS
jgi:hypothetical protein